MLEVAQRRVNELNLGRSVELCEMDVTELGDEEPESYDVVISYLCFSELSEDELSYALGETRRILKPGGALLIADEVKPKGILKRMLNLMIRIPLAVVAYLIAQTTTRAIKDLPERIEMEGLK